MTEDYEVAKIFLEQVDSSSVMHNTSTRMADGYRYGFGTEVGISTSKIHERGPVWLDGLMTTKYLVESLDCHIVEMFSHGEKCFTHI